MGPDKRTKVLVVAPYPPPYSGPEVSCKTLLESRFTAVFNAKLLKTNVRTTNKDKGCLDTRMVLAFFRFIFRLLYLLVSFRPRIVYHYATATRLGWLGRDLWCIGISRLFRARVVIHMRAGHFIYHFNGMTAIERLLIRTGCNAASLVLCQSESLASQFRRIAPRSRIDFIYNMIDTEKFSNPALLAYEKNAVLFLGHLDHSKGYCDLIKALPRVVAAHPAAQFYFAGTKIKLKKRPHNVLHNQLTGARLDWVDPDQCFDDCVRGQYDRHYIYLGVLDEEKKIDWLRRCNMLVLPSYSEGFSMAVLEALAVGKPVVCTPVGALADVIQDGVHGLWVQPGDVEGLAKVIIAMLADGDTRDRMAATNYQYARSQFSKERIADQLIGRMQQVAGG